MHYIFLVVISIATALSISTMGKDSDNDKKMQPYPLADIFVGQLGVGHDYAFYKALAGAKLDPSVEWKSLSKKDKEKFLESELDELSEGVPVFISPENRVHAVDQHHDMYVLYHIAEGAQFDVPIIVLRDFSKEKLSAADYKKAVKDNNWIYPKHIDKLLGNPIGVKDLVDVPERSVVGMAFLRFDDKKIPLKGKFFVPFIQFLFIDFLKDQNLMTFHKTFSTDDVDKLVDLLENSAEVKKFLNSHLLASAPKELKKFLEP